VMRLLDKDPARRPVTAGALAREIAMVRASLRLPGSDTLTNQITADAVSGDPTFQAAPTAYPSRGSSAPSSSPAYGGTPAPYPPATMYDGMPAYGPPKTFEAPKALTVPNQIYTSQPYDPGYEQTVVSADQLGHPGRATSRMEARADRRRAKKRSSSQLQIWIAGAVIALLAALLGYLLVHRPTANASTSAVVPPVVGEATKAARRDIVSANLSAVILFSPSNQTPAGIVISQSPSAGSKIHVGDQVTITVSSGRQGRSSAPMRPLIGTEPGTVAIIAAARTAEIGHSVGKGTI